MLLKTTINGREVTFDTAQGKDISIAVKQGPDTVNAYYIPDAEIKPFAAGSFIGSVAQGGSCNCEDITFNAHGNGTHTECLGHISSQRIALHQCMKEFFFIAELVTINPTEASNGDRIVTAGQLDGSVKPGTTALVIRTLPNNEGKLSLRYSGTNPAYLTKEAAEWIRDSGIEHLVIDTPSVDREEDGGALEAHYAFWNYPQNPRMHCTITEMVYVPHSIADGRYLLNIMAGAFASDASPSRIVLYEMMGV